MLSELKKQLWALWALDSYLKSSPRKLSDAEREALSNLKAFWYWHDRDLDEAGLVSIARHILLHAARERLLPEKVVSLLNTGGQP